jgi:hypothetical protein
MIAKRQSTRPMNNNVVVDEVKDSSSMVLSSSNQKKKKDCKNLRPPQASQARKNQNDVSLDQHDFFHFVFQD